METRANYILLGAFTIVAALAIIFFSIWISKGEFGNVARYDIVFTGPVSGLAKGSDVRFNGIKVGDVESLRIDEQDPQRVVARVKIDADTPVRTSSQATLEGVGLTGVNQIQLTAGNPNDKLLKPGFGEPPPRIYAKPGALNDLMNVARQVANNANEDLVALKKLLNDENVSRLSSAIHNLQTASEKLSKPGGAIENVSNAAASVTRLSNDAHGQLDKVAARIDHAAAAADDMAEQVSDEALPNVSSAARDLRRLSVSLQRLSGELEEGQVSLVPGAGQAKPVVKVNP